MTTFNRRQFSHLLGAAAASSLLGRAAHAAPRTITVASLFGEDKPETKIWQLIRDQVEKSLPGRFDFRIVQNAALGGEKQVAEGIRLGSIQASLSTVSAVSSWVPDSQILDLPFLFKDRSHVRRALDGKLGQEFKDRFAAQGFKVLGFINYGARHLLAKEAIATPAGISGKRIRVIQSPLHTELWKAYGARPTAIPITETYNALKTGVVDAMDLAKSAYAGFKLHEVVPYLIETSHIWATGIVYVSQTFWKSLSEEEQAVFAAAGLQGARAFDDLIIADETTSVAAVTAAGGKVIPAQNLAEWRDGARKVWTQLAPSLGGLERIEAIARS
ncbi:MAG: TRAP transporter substrate-binding protein [Porticoccaceae bacterium]